MDRIRGYEPTAQQSSADSRSAAPAGSSTLRAAFESGRPGDVSLRRAHSAHGNMDRVRGYEANDIDVESSRFSSIAFGGRPRDPETGEAEDAHRAEETVPAWAEEVEHVRRPKKFTVRCHYLLGALLLVGGVALFGTAVNAARELIPTLDSGNAEVLAIVGVISNPKALQFQVFMGCIGIALISLSMVSCIASDSDAPGSNLCRLLFLFVEIILMIALFSLAATAPGHAVEKDKDVQNYFSSLDPKVICEISKKWTCRGWNDEDCGGADDIPVCPACVAYGVEEVQDEWGGCGPALKGSVTAGTYGSLTLGILMGLLLLLDTICVVLVFPCLHVEDSRRVIFKRKSEFGKRPFQPSPW